MHEVLVNRLGGLSLPRKSVVRLTDRPDMTLDVYRGRKTTMQHVRCCFSAEPKQKLGRGLVDCKLVNRPPPPSTPSNFIDGRPKAALLFWFFGDFRCGVLFLRLFSLSINIK